MTPDYQGARDLFAAARNASLENERLRQMFAAMESAEVLPAPSGGVRVSGGFMDPMRRVDARIDKESMWYRRIEQNESVMDAATCVLYGEAQDGRGGVDALLGPAYADVLWWRYLAAEKWDTVARMVGYSVRRCHELASTALDYIDANGTRATVSGEGRAEI